MLQSVFCWWTDTRFIKILDWNHMQIGTVSRSVVTLWRHNGIAVDTLALFWNLLSKSNKLGQCIHTSEVSRNLTSNFSEVSWLCYQLISKKGHRRKQKKVKTKVSRQDILLGKNGENFRVCKKNSTIWTQLELAVFEFFPDFAWVFSRFCLSFEFFWAWVFFTMSKKKPCLMSLQFWKWHSTKKEVWSLKKALKRGSETEMN